MISRTMRKSRGDNKEIKSEGDCFAIKTLLENKENEADKDSGVVSLYISTAFLASKLPVTEYNTTKKKINLLITRIIYS